MKISELIEELKKAQENIGDIEVCTEGYFGTNAVKGVKIVTWGDMGRYVGECYDEPDPTPVIVFFPSNLP